MSVWLAGAVIALGAAVWLLAPLARVGRQGTALGRTESALAIFEDQLAEVERDADRGIISGEEAKAAKAEIKRRIVQTAREGSGDGPRAASGAWALIAAALLTPVLGLALYMQLGAPTVESLPFAERSAERSEFAELVRLTDELKARLDADANGGPSEGWELLGQTYMRMERYALAAQAFAVPSTRPDVSSALVSQYAESLVALENGAVTPAAEALIDRALEISPLNPAGAFYKSIALEQRGELETARDILISRLRASEAQAPWQTAFVDLTNMIGARLGLAPVALTDFVAPRSGPTQADIAAAQAMSPEEQSAFIASMVEGLAERLAESPDDLNGWIQLGRAYLVLKREEDARAAFEAADRFLDDVEADDPRRILIERALSD